MTTGTIAALLFIAANAYHPAKLIVIGITGETEEITRFFKSYLKVHIVINIMGLFFTVLHGHSAEERNFLLQMSMLLTILLCMNGAALYYRERFLSLFGDFRLIRIQRLMFYVWVMLIIGGHLML